MQDKKISVKMGKVSSKQDKKTLTKIGIGAAKLQYEASDVFWATYGKVDDPNYFTSTRARNKALRSNLTKLSEKDLVKVYSKAQKLNTKMYKKVKGK